MQIFLSPFHIDSLAFPVPYSNVNSMNESLFVLNELSYHS